MRPCRSTFLLLTCVTYLGFPASPGFAKARDIGLVLTAASGLLNVAQANHLTAAGQFPLQPGSFRNRLQATQAKKTIAAYTTTYQSSNVARRTQRGWLWWSLVLIGVLGATGGFLYLLRRFGKAKKTEPETLSNQGSLSVRPVDRKSSGGEFDTNISTHLQPGNNGYNSSALTQTDPSKGTTVQPSTDLLAVEMPSRLAKINIADELIKELCSPDRTKRQKAIWDLGQQGDSRSVQPLVDLMLDSDSQQRSLILAALGEIGTRTLQPMNRALAISLQDENAEVRKNAIRDLTRVYDLMFQISHLLCHAVEDPDAEVQETARWALSQMNRIRAVPSQRREQGEQGSRGAEGQRGRGV